MLKSKKKEFQRENFEKQYKQRSQKVLPNQALPQPGLPEYNRYLDPFARKGNRSQKDMKYIHDIGGDVKYCDKCVWYYMKKHKVCKGLGGRENRLRKLAGLDPLKNVEPKPKKTKQHRIGQKDLKISYNNEGGKINFCKKCVWYYVKSHTKCKPKKTKCDRILTLQGGYDGPTSATAVTFDTSGSINQRMYYYQNLRVTSFFKFVFN